MILTQLNVSSWSAISFLAFYLVCLIGCCVGIYLIRNRVMDRFESVLNTDSELNKYETAVLVGGPPRFYQLAVLELLKFEAASYKPASLFTRSRLLFKQQPDQKLDPAPKMLLATLIEKGDSGLYVDEAPKLLHPVVAPYRVVLAKHGLKPTPAERSKACWWLSTPLIVLGGIGTVRVFNGLWANRPVAFLLLLMIATFFAVVGVFAFT